VSPALDQEAAIVMASKEPASRSRHELIPPIAKAGAANLSFGGLSRDGAFAWVGYEDEVALFDCETNERRAVWMFQKINQEEEEEEVILGELNARNLCTSS